MPSKSEQDISHLRMHRSTFTLIELLIVIAIIAVLATVVILVLNPAQMLAQARDSDRVSDLHTLNQALTLYSEDVGGNMGAASTTYISIPDPSATSTLGDQCQGLGLPALPTGETYHCAASSTYRDINGEGWIPIDFAAISGGSPLGSLPVDPVNQTSSGLYYTYMTNGSQYEFTATMEFREYGLGGSNDVVSADGGILPDTYEIGTNLTLDTVDRGPNVVGEWLMDEGTGTIAYDSSAYEDNGTLEGNTDMLMWTSADCIEGNCLNFDGTDDYVDTGSGSPLDIASQMTVSAWINPSSLAGYPGIVGRWGTSNDKQYKLVASFNGNGVPYFDISGNGTSDNYRLANTTITTNTWTYIVGVYSGTNVSIYLNGDLANGAFTGSVPGSLYSSPSHTLIGGGSNNLFSGLLDEIHIYNRALSASEIQTLYNTGKP